MRWRSQGRCLRRYSFAGDELGGTGLEGFLAVATDADAGEAHGLDRSSRVQLFGIEGATDLRIYAAIVGRTAEEVVA
jgi:hypothetical protein